MNVGMQSAPGVRAWTFATALAICAGQPSRVAMCAPFDDGGKAAAAKFVNALNDEEQRAGWKLLFDGKSLDGWANSDGSAIRRPIEDGCLNPHRAGHYMIVHKTPWENFTLALDFKIAKGCNSGIFVRTHSLKPRPGKDVGFNGIEVAIDDTDTATAVDTGAIYDLAKPTQNAMRPAGEWNRAVVRCFGAVIEVEINGIKVNRVDLDEFTKPHQRPDGSRHKFDIAFRDFPRRGYIGLQDHGGDCWYRNIKLLAHPSEAAGDGYDQMQLGKSSDGRIVVPTNQVLKPYGAQWIFPGRPVDLSLSPNGRWLAVLNLKEVVLFDAASGKPLDRRKVSGSSFTGIRFTPDGKRLFASTIPGKSDKKKAPLLEFEIEDKGGVVKLEAKSPLQLPGKSPVPAGLALTDNGKSLLVALNLNNSIGEMDLASRKLIREIPVGVAPYDVLVVGSRAYVSNWGGTAPAVKSKEPRDQANKVASKQVSASPPQPTGPSGGSQVKVDAVRHIASEGTVAVIDLPSGKVVAQIIVGLHPSGLAVSPNKKFLYVANANSDTVSVIATATNAVVETIPVRPDGRLLFGASPGALAVSPDGGRLFVAMGGANAVGVVELATPKSRLLGCIPVGWYPSAIAVGRDGKTLHVANLKGTGSLDESWQGKRELGGKPVYGRNSRDHQGSISVFAIPQDQDLPPLTHAVLENNRRTASISALAPPRPFVAPRPVPERHGEPSVFKHVVYIIKENRTYDQVFGDLRQGNGDARLCIFGKDVTPNHHKIVDEFVLLDNFYCSGVLSADGHQWANEAFVTGYLERAFGGFPRSYPYDGDDALAYAPTGFLWDGVLAQKKSLRVYGEFVKATIRWKDPERKGRPKFIECYRDFMDKTGKIDIVGKAAIKTIEPHLCPTYIGFPSIVPDVYRAAEFVKELKQFEAKGAFPNFTVMLLPNDHTSGTRPDAPTPAAAVADNDLALGRIVESISRSRFWKETCIFVVQDDPQNGFDHVDGHRTVAMVISPYTKRRAVDSTNYNQTSMVRTMELLLGLPPMNQFDSAATPMASCFTDFPDYTAYAAVPNIVPLDALNPPLAAIRNPRQLHWARKSLELPLDDVDEADEDTLNRILWFATKGRDDTYPAWAVAQIKDDDDD